MQATAAKATAESIASGEASAGELAATSAMDMAEDKARGTADTLLEDERVVKAGEALAVCKAT